MTIDKIKHYMNPIIWEHWKNCNDLEVLENAKKQLKYELENKILSGIEYIAELELLELKTN